MRVYLLLVLPIVVWILAWKSQCWSVWWFCLKMRFSYKTAALNALYLWIHLMVMSLTCFGFVCVENYPIKKFFLSSNSYSLSFWNKHVLIFPVWIFRNVNKLDREQRPGFCGVRAAEPSRNINAFRIQTQCFFNMSFNMSGEGDSEAKKSKKTKDEPYQWTFTCQSFSPRDGRVHGVGSSNPARSDGGQIGGGDDAGHGHLPIRGPVKGDTTTLLTWTPSVTTRAWISVDYNTVSNVKEPTGFHHITAAVLRIISHGSERRLFY